MNGSGRARMDCKGYESLLDGNLREPPPPEELLARSKASMGGLPRPWRFMEKTRITK